MFFSGGRMVAENPTLPNPCAAVRRALALLLCTPLLLTGRKFYDDDPIVKMPPPMHVDSVVSLKLSDYYDFFLQTFGKPGEAQPPKASHDFDAGHIPAVGINTLGEVPDSEWFTNRIGSRPYSVEEATQGPRLGNAPSRSGPWTIISAKSEGVTPGFNFEDSVGRRYLLKFDPATNPEMTTAVDAIGAAFFHALGYNVPENYVVTFDESQLVLGKGSMVTNLRGDERLMVPSDISDIIDRVPRDGRGRIRGMASHYLEGLPIGEFRYHETRPDDPNDIYPHEHRRDLRGMFVFSAWLGHDDSRAINTLDMLVEEAGKKFIKHHLIDFGSILGSASIYANSSRSGNERLFRFKPASIQVLTLGLLVPRWARAHYRTFPEAGLFDYRHFDPEEYHPEQRNPAFENRLPDDTFWAAKKVMAFTDEHIRAILKLGEYTNAEAEAWLAECIIKRRDIVGRTYFSKVLPLDDFRVAAGRLEFDDLAVRFGFEESQEYGIQWSRFDNDAETLASIEGANDLLLPREALAASDGEYFAARIQGRNTDKTVVVYIRRRPGSWQVVGIDRTW